MSDTEQRLEPGMHLGDYQLKELLYEGTATKTWLADQISVNREVIIDSLNRAVHSDEEVVANYLSDVRTKAKVDHPLIGSVFEAVREEGICFYAREKIPGVTLFEMIIRREKLKPIEIVHLLRQVADANLYLESKRLASLPLSANQVFASDSGMCRIVNMAVGGMRDHNVSREDKLMLGENFLKLLKMDEPGATRTTSLLEYLTDTEREIPITWEQVRDLAVGVERQLTEPPVLNQLKSSTMLIKKKEKKHTGRTIAIIVCALAVGGIITKIATHESKLASKDISDVVVVDVKAYHEKFNGAKLKEFTIDSHEVTIAEYAKFLKELSPSLTERIQHENQPDYKVSYIPDDWDAMYAAAEKGEEWQGHKMSLDSPVVNVDWWDAYIFAEYYSRRLPTKEEWKAALLTSGTEAQELKPSAYGAVNKLNSDVTANKIYGLSGNVAEWSSKLMKPESDPMAIVKKPVIFGGSYNDNPTGNANTMRWLDPSDGEKDARDLRRPYIGFRTVGQP